MSLGGRSLGAGWGPRLALARKRSGLGSKRWFEGKAKESPVHGNWTPKDQDWGLPGGRPSMPGLVLCFRVDGRFSLWDPTQHYWKRNVALGVNEPNRPDALHFAPGEAWDAIKSDEGKVICRGLIEDWVTWQQTDSPEFGQLCEVLKRLSPSPDEPLVPGDPMPVWLDDVRLYPTLQLPYGLTPVTLASAGMQRIILMAYLLVWAWHGHLRTSGLLHQTPERRLVILYDEPETHLHPEWQRRLLPALMQVAAGLNAEMKVQFLVSTHAPLMLASLEPEFDSERDQLFHFALSETKQPTLEPMDFAKFGDAVNWLVSDVFGLSQGRGSVPAEEAIEAAERYMRGEAAKNRPGLQHRDEIDARLKLLLGGLDSFWPRWLTRTGQVPNP